MIIADTNEFHPLLDGMSYRDAREPDGTIHPIVIMRATYGLQREDLMYAPSIVEAARADLLVGHYGYMRKNIPADAQGHFFGQIVKSRGGIKPGDTIWCDAEEGSGDQSVRVDRFLGAAHDVLHDPLKDEGIYSGAAFWIAHLAAVPSTNALRWVAAYGQSDPMLMGEDLWQFTDKKVFTGIGGACDASIFRGTLEDFRSLVDPPAPIEGPFRHVVNHRTTSFDVVAHDRNTTVDELATITRANVNMHHMRIFNAYMTLRDYMMAIGEPSPAMPIGFVYWTVNP